MSLNSSIFTALSIGALLVACGDSGSGGSGGTSSGGYPSHGGPTGDRGSFSMYRWSGRRGDAPTQVTGIDLKNLRPEALFAIPDSSRVQLLSDDGGIVIGSIECKSLPGASPTFRSLSLTIRE